MWWGGVDMCIEVDVVCGCVCYGIVGECNEDECFGFFNLGMFNVIFECGDVKGVFVGYDYINDYVGDYYGV